MSMWNVTEKEGVWVVPVVTGLTGRPLAYVIPSINAASTARLIAMAPDLLDALKMIAKKQETGEGEFSVRDLCNELIAEAEGRE